MRLASLFRVSLAVLPLLLSAAAFAAPAANAPRNLLANPGFEKRRPATDWMPAAWDTSNAGLATVFFGRDTFDVHGGQYAVNVANTSTLYSMGHNWSQAVLVGPESWGKTAVFSIWTRSNGVQGRAYILLQAYRDTVSKMSVIWGVDRDEAMRRLGIVKINDPLRDLGWERKGFEDEMTGWVRREARVVIGRGTNILFVRGGLLGTGQLLLDDASLTLEPTPAPKPIAAGVNVLADPDFENGASAWEWAIPPFEGARIDRDTVTVHSGRTSMRLSRFEDGLVPFRMGMAQSVRAVGLRGKRVRMSAWMKGDSLTTSAYVSIGAHTPTGFKPSGGGMAASGTFDWTLLSIEFDVPKDAETLWAWTVVGSPAEGTAWIDDASLVVIGPSESGSQPAPKSAAAKKPSR